jgi:hypothetical protein
MLRKCFRLLTVSIALSGLTACAPLISLVGYSSSAVQVAVQLDRAKLVSDGISYLRSGKTITDHAVSMIARADCRVLNVITPDPVCTPRRDDNMIARNERMNLAALREELRNAAGEFDAPANAAPATPGAEQPDTDAPAVDRHSPRRSRPVAQPPLAPPPRRLAFFPLRSNDCIVRTQGEHP